MFIAVMMLALESNCVVVLRMLKFMSGDKDALLEARLMVKEKVDSIFEATAGLMSGASGEDVIINIAGMLQQTRNGSVIAGNLRSMPSDTQGISERRPPNGATPASSEPLA